MELIMEIPKKILVIRNDHMGDLILSTCVFRELKKAFPKSKITAVVSNIGKPIIEKNPYVDELMIIPHGKQFFKKFYLYPSIWNKIRKEKFDVGIDLRGDFSNAFFLMTLPRIKRKIGFFKNERTKKILDFMIFKNASRHETLIVKELIEKSFNIKSNDSSPEIFVTKEDEKEADDFIREHNLKKFICINPDATHEGKQWPLEKFDELIKWLKKRYPEEELVLVGADKEKLDWLFDRTSGLIRLERANLRMLYCLFKKCDLNITLDGGPMHLAWVGKSKLLALILKFSEPSVENIKPLGENTKYLLETDKKISVKEVKKEVNKFLK